MPADRIAIAGAGISGLTAALAFARKGIASDIFEQATRLVEVGAGLQISPNASHILAKLGILKKVEAVWCEPDQIDLISGTSLRAISHVPSGRFARDRWGAPYGVLHRASLQAALLEAVQAEPLCNLKLASRLTAIDRPTNGSGPYRLTIGADGVWSEMRRGIPNGPEPAFSGNVAWRFVLPASSVPRFLSPGNVSAFLGPSAHLVCYPLKEANAYNLVAVASGVNPGETWDSKATEVQRQMLLSRLGGWHEALLDVLANAPAPSFWPLYQMRPGRWHNGLDTVLIGDAAHAMMPFAAQGAAMAIEDAFLLASNVADAGSNPRALSAFEAERAPRIARVRSRGAFNQFAYHARGPLRLGRDLVLGLRPPQSLAADLDWLYGYRSRD
ncbi:MAG TPA: FAD-dependent monooxygenase [Pseudorhizobium sp.]|nr:FAD-dependent monooxygenase [Pseudorhizobium sp.]